MEGVTQNQVVQAYIVKTMDREPLINIVCPNGTTFTLTRDQVRESITRLNIALGASAMRHGEPDADGNYSGGWVSDAKQT